MIVGEVVTLDMLGNFLKYPRQHAEGVEHMIDQGRSWASSAGVRASMQSNRGRDTKPELSLRHMLHRRGLRYYVNRRPIPSLRRTADIVFPRRKIAVFVDGCFWHGCPDHHTVSKTNPEYWSEKVRLNKQRDQETTLLMREAGWMVLRFWEHVSAEEASDEVERVVNLRRSQAS